MTREREKKFNFLKLNSYFDYTLLFLTIFLICFGLIMIYSSSSYVAQRSSEYNNDAAYFLKKQLKAAILGLVAMILAMKFNYKWFRKVRFLGMPLLGWFYILCLLLQLYVLFWGAELNGKKRWIMIGGTSFQPSDLTKLAVILAVAYLIYLSPRKLDNFWGFAAIIILMSPVIVFIVIANLSTAIVVTAIVVGMCFVASRRKWYYILAVSLIGSVAFLYVKLSSNAYRIERINIWLNIDTHDKGYQIRQGLYAIASGGLTGSGLGGSMQKLGYIPEAQNDMIFTVICEELGILGALVTMFLFLILLYRIYIIAINAPDLFGSMICVGVMIHIAVQVIINVAVVTNSIPSTGIPMPFISYGGTSLLILMAEIGVVLSVSNQIRHER